MDPDQLAFSEDLHCFQMSLFLVSHCFQKGLPLGLSCLCITCPLEQVKFSLDKHIMDIYLSLGKYKSLLFPHPSSLHYTTRSRSGGGCWHRSHSNEA